jgi:pimeloyl-ACP methyl ester carboxylesterase
MLDKIRRTMPNRPPKPQVRPNFTNSAPPEVVDPRWILQALGVVIAFAILCAYLTVCGLFSYGQWQLVLQPSRAITQTPKDLNLAFMEVHFGVDASGQPQLDGWWIPGDMPSYPTVIMLHSGQGSMSDALPEARTLHDAQLNVLLFDYRGFGRSGGKHPTEVLMEGDAESALSYVTGLRGIPSSSVIAYGSGAGASLAAKLCTNHKEIAALILQNPNGDFEARVRQDSRSRMVPISLLFHERFPLADRLRSLSTPKLLISSTSGPIPANLASAANPKLTVELAPGQDQAALHDSLRRFLDTYVPQKP